MPDPAEQIVGILRRESGAEDVHVDGLRRLAGGASREIWALRATFRRPAGEETLELVLRRGSTAPGMAAAWRTEVETMQAAFAAGVPVPKIHWAGEEADFGAWVVMDFVEGEAIGRRILRDESYAAAREALTRQFAGAAARIHAIPPGEIASLPRPEGSGGPAAAEIDRYRQVFAAALEPHPAIELGFDWLVEHAPADTELRVVHGDFRMGNVLVGPEGLRAVLDWELPHLGDPVEDLGWLCVRAWRFGNDRLPVGGVGTREELLEAYAAASGARVDAEHLRFWEVFGNVKWAVINTMQAQTHVDGTKPSLELASLGRRTAETELEILELLEEA